MPGEQRKMATRKQSNYILGCARFARACTRAFPKENTDFRLITEVKMIILWDVKEPTLYSKKSRVIPADAVAVFRT